MLGRKKALHGNDSFWESCCCDTKWMLVRLVSVWVCGALGIDYLECRSMIGLRNTIYFWLTNNICADCDGITTNQNGAYLTFVISDQCSGNVIRPTAVRVRTIAYTWYPKFVFLF